MTTATTQGTYIVVGPPGTGKTSYLAGKTRDFADWASAYHPENRTPVLLCSLTRSAAAEIAGRDLPLPRECVGTLHSHAYRSLGCPPVAETQIEEWNKAHAMYRLSGGEVDTENPEWDRRSGTPGDELANEYGLLRSRMVDRAMWPSRIQSFAAKWEQWKTDSGTIDFTDMIDYALRDCEYAPGLPLILIADEAQDLSAMELALLRRWGESAGNLVITGDPYQALYVWRGAHPEVFLDQSIPQEHRRVLGQSWRVPRAVHAAAMRWVSQLSVYQPLDYQPRDYEGSVGRISATWKVPDRAIDAAEALLAEGKSVMFQASCSFFLQPLVGILRKRGLPFSNPWRTKRGDWNPLGGRGMTMAKRMLALARPVHPWPGHQQRYWTYREMAAWTDVLSAKGVLMHGAKAEIGQMADSEAADQAVSFDKLQEWLEIPAYLDVAIDAIATWPLEKLLAWWQERLLPAKAKASHYPMSVATQRGLSGIEEEPRLFVGTGHSFKGSEADCTFIFPDLSPSGYREWCRRGEPRDSIIRLFYVMLTRARESVILCDPSSDQIANLYPLLN